MLEKVGNEHALEVRGGQLGVEDICDDHRDSRVSVAILVHAIYDPSLLRWDGVHELAAPSCWVQDDLGAAHPEIDVLGNDVPHPLPTGLVNIPEAIIVEPVKVDHDVLSRRSCCWPARGTPLIG